jgi:hypothetical protein
MLVNEEHVEKLTEQRMQMVQVNGLRWYVKKAKGASGLVRLIE